MLFSAGVLGYAEAVTCYICTDCEIPLNPTDCSNSNALSNSTDRCSKFASIYGKGKNLRIIDRDASIIDYYQLLFLYITIYLYYYLNYT